MDIVVPILPLSDCINASVRWMQLNLDGVFGAVKWFFTAVDDGLRAAFGAVPTWAIIGGIALLLVLRRRFAAAAAIAIMLMVIANLGLWRAATDTVVLVLIASMLSIAIGAPVGILMAESRIARAVVTPVLDYMQATPAFVYLIPAVLFFGIGAVPGVLATSMFALPPIARSLALGLSQVNPQLVEAGHAFGGSRMQILIKIKLPLARPYFRAGVNQCIMMSLSMVVICSLIGARGLGIEVISALSQVNLAQGIEAGIAVVLVAAVLDRLFASDSRRLS